MKIKAYHDPYDVFCREPFGALPCGGGITLRVIVAAEEHVSPYLRVWDGRERILSPAYALPAGEFFKGQDGSRVPRAALFEGGVVYGFTLSAGDKPGLMWYSFRLETERGCFYVGAVDETLRCGCVCGQELPIDYRVTVYAAGFKTPDWFKGSIAYQIFPDRFFVGGDGPIESGAEYHRSKGRRIYKKDWHELPDYLPRGGAPYYSPVDYYFGNFMGIVEKIPHLKSLGVSVLYLNPVFESPYNHRYSISDYMRTDPLLGSEEDFALMCAELKKHGIRVILDGVFSHTGDDSVYFDRQGVYGGGAYGNEASPYRSWYVFDKKYKCGYRSWWGFDTLPEVDELQPSYMHFIAEVLEKWMRLGASGWRLDVADELPDDFIRFLRKTVKAIDPEAVLIGEVWEDASTKKGDFDGRGTIGRRGYTDGDMLDGVMDYPFADAVCDFLSGCTGAAELDNALLSQLAGYPDEFMRAQLGMLGSHDTYRVLSRLSGAPPKDTLSREVQAVWRPEPYKAERGKKRLMQAAALQFAMPFAPCIYYGDEAGLKGLSDPFCRKPYPWGSEDGELLSFYRRLTSVRAGSSVFRAGGTAFAAPDDDAFAVYRGMDNAGDDNSKAGAVLTLVTRKAHRVILHESDFRGSARARLSNIKADIKLLSPEGACIAMSAEEGGLAFDLPDDCAVVVEIKE